MSLGHRVFKIESVEEDPATGSFFYLGSTLSGVATRTETAELIHASDAAVLEEMRA
jgi:hypothetical protein